MKPFYVKAEGVSHEKQQELLDLAVDAGATLCEYRPYTRHVTSLSPNKKMNANWDYFGVTDGLSTFFDEHFDTFGDNAVEMTYDQAWEYVTGIIRAKESPMSREGTIDWLRENTTREDWTRGDLVVTGWTVERLLYSPFHRLRRDGEVIQLEHVLPLAVSKASPLSAPAKPHSSLLDRIKQALGSDTDNEDMLIHKINVITTVANAAEHFVKATHYIAGNNFDFDEMNKRLDLLVAVLDVKTPTPVSPKLDRSKSRNKYDHEIIPGVHVDVYDVLNAFPTGGADIDHAIKKLLQPGGRGHKDEITDCEEAIKSIQRRIDHIKEWGGQ